MTLTCSRCPSERNTTGRYCRKCRAGYQRERRRSRKTYSQGSNLAFVARETFSPDAEAFDLASAVADLSDEFARSAA